MLREKLLRLEKQRAHSEPLPSGPSPYTSSSFFKTPTATPKPKAKSWNHLFSNAALNQGTSVLKAFARSKSLSPDTISLGTGRPSAEFYPWTSLSMHTAATTSSNSNPTTSPPPQTTMTTTCSITDTSPSAYNLAAALNYGYAAGSPQLVRFVTEHVELVHDPPYADWETCLTAGTTAALDTVLGLFCERGEDTLLVEAHTYAGALDAARARGLDVLGVGMDEEGLVPEELDRRLREWDGARGGGERMKKKKKKPSVLYTIPSGQNPTGATQSAARRRAIYDVAERHDLYIIEDDPYYFLQLGPPPPARVPSSSQADTPLFHQTPPPPTTNNDHDADDAYLTTLPPS